MNSEWPSSPRDLLEQRITALLLDELPSSEAAELREKIAADAELTALAKELEEAVRLVRETSRSEGSGADSGEPLRLRSKRRESLLAHFKTVTPVELQQPRWRRMSLLELAACIAILGVLAWMLLPTIFPPQREIAMSIAPRKEPEAVPPGETIGSPLQMSDALVPASSLETDGDEAAITASTSPVVPATLSVTTPLPERSVQVATEDVQQERRLGLRNLGSIDSKNNASKPSPSAASAVNGSIYSVEGRPLNGPDTRGEVGGLKRGSDRVTFDNPQGFGGGGGGGRGGNNSATMKPAQHAEPVDDPNSLAVAKIDQNESPGRHGSEPELVGSSVTVTRMLNEFAKGQTARSRRLGGASEPKDQSGGFYRLTESQPPSDATRLNFQAGDGLAIQDSVNQPTADRSDVGLVVNGKFEPRAQSRLGGSVLGPQSASEVSYDSPVTNAIVANNNWDYSAGGEASNRQKVNAGEKSLASAYFGVSDESKTLEKPFGATQDAKNWSSVAFSADKSAYLEKKREFASLLDAERLLQRKISVERVDLSLPKSAQVEVIEIATTNGATQRSLLGRVRGALSGEVERTASIKVERDRSDIDEISPAEKDANYYDPYFFATRPERIKSEAVLGRVVDQLKLDEAWAVRKDGAKLKKSEAIALLRERVEVKPRPNTTIVDIQAKSAKPEEAADIANAVAAAYKEILLQREVRLATAGIADLQKRASENQNKIQSVKAELEQMREKLKISEAVAAVGLEDLAVRKPTAKAPIPQPEILTSENNFSTFSLNVSDVSFKLAAASLQQGQMPDAASIRSEEFINAFNYHDPEARGGSPVAFVSEQARYPFAHNRDLLRFSVKAGATGRQEGRALNIVLVLDNSGSMERADRVQIIHAALKVLAGQLQPQDKLSIVTFARTPHLIVDGVAGTGVAEAVNRVADLTPEGGTNLEAAMKLAYQTAARHAQATAINRLVLLTDGAANLGDVTPESLQKLVQAQRQQGIALDCFGIGWEGYNDDLLEGLSRHGDGRYGFINSPEAAATEFASQLAGALQVAASDVKVQVEFNPRRVTSFRQIGYAKHQLTKEQFRDNTVDAAEIAVQEAGNALYTIETNPQGVGPVATVRVRYKVPGTTSYREQSWDVPYRGSAPTLTQSSPAMRLAAVAGAFSEWLVVSPFAAEISPDALLNQLRGVPEVFGADSRPKQLEWMIRQAKSIRGE